MKMRTCVLTVFLHKRVSYPNLQNFAKNQTISATLDYALAPSFINQTTAQEPDVAQKKISMKMSGAAKRLKRCTDSSNLTVAFQLVSQ